MTSALVLLLLAAAPDAGVTDAAKRLEARLSALETELRSTRKELAETREALEVASEDVATVKDELTQTNRSVTALGEREDLIRENSVSWSGYLDVGFFAVQGNGSGVRKDTERLVSNADDVLSTWVLRGDPLATAINSRGEPADIGDSRVIGFDGLRTGGRPTVLVNNANLQLRATIGPELLVHVMVDLLPRERTVTHFALGDFLDIKLATLSWRRRFGFGDLTVWGGKVDSVLGVEYRFQESPDRLTVSPSLLCRYTCGRALGVRARGQFLDEKLEVLAAVTNGSNQIEVMPWGAEAGFNASPTISGRVGALLPVGAGLELSVNGMVGVQDRQSDPTVWQFHAGAAAKVDLSTVFFTAEGGFGRAAGKTGVINGEAVPCTAASCLVYRGAYLLGGWRATTWLTPYARVDWRSGTMRQARDWAYESIRVRATAGVRVEPVRHLTIKAEYTLNRELLGADFPDDVFTTSVIVSY